MSPENPHNGPEQESQLDAQLREEAGGDELLYAMLVQREAMQDYIAENKGLHNLDELEQEQITNFLKQINVRKQELGLIPPKDEDA